MVRLLDIGELGISKKLLVTSGGMFASNCRVKGRNVSDFGHVPNHFLTASGRINYAMACRNRTGPLR